MATIARGHGDRKGRHYYTTLQSVSSLE